MRKNVPNANKKSSAEKQVCQESSSCVFLIFLNKFSVGFEGKQYHRSCFVCQKCNNEIGTSHFFKTKDGKYICQHCSIEQQPSHSSKS